MSRWGARLQGAQLGLHAGYLLTQLGCAVVSWWSWNPFFAGVALLAVLLQPLYWRRLLPGQQVVYRQVALGTGLTLLIVWGLYGYV